MTWATAFFGVFIGPSVALTVGLLAMIVGIIREETKRPKR